MVSMGIPYTYNWEDIEPLSSGTWQLDGDKLIITSGDVVNEAIIESSDGNKMVLLQILEETETDQQTGAVQSFSVNAKLRLERQ